MLVLRSAGCPVELAGSTRAPGNVARERPALLVVAAVGPRSPETIETIERLSVLGVPLVVTYIEVTTSPDQPCQRAGARWVARAEQPLKELLETITIACKSCVSKPVRSRSERAPGGQRSPTRDVAAELWRLTRREKLILGAMMEGHSVREIAASGFVSTATVRSQVRSIFLKLGVKSQLAAVALAHRNAWRPESPSPKVE